MQVSQNSEPSQVISAMRDKLHSGDLETAKNAARELAEIDSGVAVLVFAETLRFQWTEVTGTVIEVLAEIGDAAAIAVLAQALEHKDFWIRWGAAHALGALGGEVAEKALVQALTRTKHRASVIEGLASIELKECGLKGDTLVAALVAIIASKSSLRERAIDVLGSIGNEAAILALEEVVIRYRSPRLWSSATEALANIGTSQAINALTRLLQNKNWNIRESVVIALGACANRHESATALAQALKDKDDDIREYAIRELRRMDHESALPVLAQAVKHPESNTVINAIWALSTINNPAAISAISQALDHEDLHVREKAASLLEEVRHKTE